MKETIGSPPDYRFGVLAGDRSVDPISSLIIPGDDDGKVSIESAKLQGMADFMVVHASHLFFPSDGEVHRQTAYFLRHGSFRRKDSDGVQTVRLKSSVRYFR